MKLEHNCYKIYSIHLEPGETLSVHFSKAEGDRPVQIGIIDSQSFSAMSVSFPPFSFSVAPTLFIVPSKVFPVSDMVVDLGSGKEYHLSKL